MKKYSKSDYLIKREGVKFKRKNELELRIINNEVKKDWRDSIEIVDETIVVE